MSGNPIKVTLQAWRYVGEYQTGTWHFIQHPRQDLFKETRTEMYLERACKAGRYFSLNHEQRPQWAIWNWVAKENWTLRPKLHIIKNWNSPGNWSVPGISCAGNQARKLNFKAFSSWPGPCNSDILPPHPTPTLGFLQSPGLSKDYRTTRLFPRLCLLLQCPPVTCCSAPPPQPRVTAACSTDKEPASLGPRRQRCGWGGRPRYLWPEGLCSLQSGDARTCQWPSSMSCVLWPLGSQRLSWKQSKAISDGKSFPASFSPALFLPGRLPSVPHNSCVSLLLERPFWTLKTHFFRLQVISAMIAK